MTLFLKKHQITIVGILLGAVAGFFYWQQIGCVSGTCMITSDPVNSTLYGALMGGLAFNIFQKKQSYNSNTSSKKMEIQTLIAEKNCTILDVRTIAEYADGHVNHSINIPLNELSNRLDEIKALKQPLVLCCASGVRSNKALKYLTEQGIDCVNAGGWSDVYEICCQIEENSNLA